LRNPMVIVSPYAKPGYTDHTTAVQPYSMLAFIDHIFGLPNLTPTVAATYDYTNAFNFAQSPLAPVPMTSTHISAATKAKVKSLARFWRTDPT
jgi:phospholipase C